MIDNLPFSVSGHVLATDKDTGEVLLDRHNDIHAQNMARVIARGLANEAGSGVYKLALGNGGTHIDASLNITYLTPNTTGTSATLYNQTYDEVVNPNDVTVGENNSTVSSASPTPALSSIVVVSCELAPSEPAGQPLDDGGTVNPDNDFAFDEMGLLSTDEPPLLLSHLIFSPIQKSQNRTIVITYTLTINVS